MLKGHTKIELTDVHTGDKEVIESNNIVTNAVENIINDEIKLYQSENASIKDGYSLNFKNSSLIYYFGGLVCFEDTNDEDVNAYKLNKINKAVAYGAYKDSTADSNFLEKGIFNTTESSISKEDKKVTFVYDFSTQQGNGTISSISLIPQTASTGAYFGRNGLSNFNKTSGMLDTTAFFGIDLSSLKEKCQAIYFGKNNVYAMSTNDQNLTIYKYSPKFTAFHLVDDSTNDFTLIDSKTFTPNGGWHFPQFSSQSTINSYVKEPKNIKLAYVNDTFYVYLIGAEYSSNNLRSLYYYSFKYDDENTTIDLHTIDLKNALGNNYCCFASGNIFQGDYVYFLESDKSYYSSSNDVSVMKIMKVNLNNNADVQEVYDISDIPKFFSYIPFFNLMIQEPYIYLAPIDNTVSSRDDFQYVLATSTASKIKMFAVTSNDFWHSKGANYIYNEYGLASFGSTDYSNNTTYIRMIDMYWFYPYLSTINNLESPVVKTSDKTMKITYTLQETE